MCSFLEGSSGSGTFRMTRAMPPVSLQYFPSSWVHLASALFPELKDNCRCLLGSQLFLGGITKCWFSWLAQAQSHLPGQTIKNSKISFYKPISFIKDPPHTHFTGEKTCPEHLHSNHFTSQFSHSGVSDSLQPNGRQHSKLPCPSSSPGVSSNAPSPVESREAPPTSSFPGFSEPP